MQRVGRLYWWAMIPIFLLCVWLTVGHLAVDIAWFDEWFSYTKSGTGPYDAPFTGLLPGAAGLPDLVALLTLAASDRWPPAYFLLLRVWDYVAQGSLFIDRALSLFLGLIALAVIYQMGRQFFNRSVALLAALLLATSSFFVFYLHELRPYTLYFLLTALMLWFYGLLQTHHWQKRWVRWGFGLSVAGLLYTHYTGAFFVLSLALYHVFAMRPKDWLNKEAVQAERWRMVLRLGFNGCLAFLPWSFMLLHALQSEVGDMRGVSWVAALQKFVDAMGNGLWWLPVLLVAYAIFESRRRKWLMLLSWGALSMVIALCANTVVSFFIDARYLLPAMLSIVLLMALALHKLQKRTTALAGLCLGLWIAGGVALINAGNIGAEDLRGGTMLTSTLDDMVAITRTCVTDDDFIVLAPGTNRLVWTRDDMFVPYLGDHSDNIILLPLLVTNKFELSSAQFPSFRLLYPSYRDRIDHITAPNGDVWLWLMPNLYNGAEDLRRFDNLMRDAGYQTDGPVLDRPDLVLYQYVRDGGDTCLLSPSATTAFTTPLPE